jgi:two-component system nitrogen regulation response regulator GlnG
VTKNCQVWVVDDDASIRWVLERALDNAGLSVQQFATVEEALKELVYEQPRVVMTDIRMQGKIGIEFLAALGRMFPDIRVIVMTAYTDLDSAVSAYRGGAFEYLPKPFDLDEVTALVKRALVEHLVQVMGSFFEPEVELIGAAPAMQEVYRLIGRLSKSTMNVLISGESGTGKELVARAIHNTSPCADKKLVAINTAAIPSELLETELFGCEKGAFTGAEEQCIGRFEQAEGGTLFLDEIGDMPLALQTRLLRVLSDGSFYRVGGHQQRIANVRVIAATNQNLERQVKDGRFREDLYHRLNVIEIPLPPLRNRPEDIADLARVFLARAANELGVEPKTLDNRSEELLRTAHWPSNVRQLENLCRRLTVMVPGKLITSVNLPPDYFSNYGGENELQVDWQKALNQSVQEKLAGGQLNLLADFGPQFERVLLRAALTFTGGRKEDAARRIGWGRNTVTRKLKELDIN